MKIIKLRSNRTERFIWIPISEVGVFYGTSPRGESVSTTIHSRNDDFTVRETPEQIILLIARAADYDRTTVVVSIDVGDGSEIKVDCY